MGILDQIANPKVPNFLEGLKVISNLETAKTNRRIAEIQAGSALQQMQATQQQQQQRQKGIATIGQALAPQADTTVSPIQAGPQAQPAAPMPVEEGPQLPVEEGPQPVAPEQPAPEEGALTQQQGQQVVQNVSQMPKAEIDAAENFTELANQLAAQGNMDLAKIYYQIAEKTDRRIKEQTATEQQETEQMLEMAFGPLSNVIKLQEAGNTEQAQAAYGQLMDRISGDPRFADNKDVQMLVQRFGTYEPGLAKYLYTTTSYGKNAREQQSKAEGTYKKLDAEGRTAILKKDTGEFVGYVTGPDGQPIIDYRATKEAGVQKRAEARIKQRATVQEQNKAKFDIKNTDSILRYKRQEDADLGDIKSSLERAFILAEKGQDMALVDKLLQQGMSKWENTSVRAQAELEKFAPQKIGGLKDRIANHLKLFFTGEMTETTRGTILDTARTLLNEYVDPQLEKSNTYWRRIGDERGLDPDQIAAYKTKEEVGDDYRAGTISRATAERILAKPRFKMK
jgi:hypothetical protein